jgi:hypothetical protein
MRGVVRWPGFQLLNPKGLRGNKGLNPCLPHVQMARCRGALGPCRWGAAWCVVLLGSISLVMAAELTSVQRKRLCTGLKTYECRVALLEFEVLLPLQINLRCFLARVLGC